VQSILKVVTKVKGPLLVLGDFNAAEASPVIETLKLGGLHDTFADAGLGYGYTYGHAMARGLDFLRIDHILASGGVRASKTFVGGEQASEHSPVVADVGF
jgi:endonuclease/exonuclease/phosphatase (EEP) superfamily protein YafD